MKTLLADNLLCLLLIFFVIYVISYFTYYFIKKWWKKTIKISRSEAYYFYLFIERELKNNKWKPSPDDVSKFRIISYYLDTKYNLSLEKFNKKRK